MELSNKQKINNYGSDIADVLNDDLLSPFDLIGTLTTRDSLEHDYDKLSPAELILLREKDQLLLDHAEEFYAEVSKVTGDVDLPLHYWWAHIDKVISGELIVDLGHHKVYLKNNELATVVLTDHSIMN